MSDDKERVTREEIQGEDNYQILFANLKRVLDEYMDLGLKDARQKMGESDRSFVQAHSVKDKIDNLYLQAVQNAIETANMVGKQAVRHAEIGIDRQWNVDEQGYTVTEILRDEVFKEALAAAVSAAVNEALTRVKA